MKIIERIKTNLVAFSAKKGLFGRIILELHFNESSGIYTIRTFGNFNGQKIAQDIKHTYRPTKLPKNATEQEARVAMNGRMNVLIQKTYESNSLKVDKKLLVVREYFGKLDDKFVENKISSSANNKGKKLINANKNITVTKKYTNEMDNANDVEKYKLGLPKDKIMAFVRKNDEKHFKVVNLEHNSTNIKSWTDLDRSISNDGFGVMIAYSFKEGQPAKKDFDQKFVYPKTNYRLVDIEKEIEGNYSDFVSAVVRKWIDFWQRNLNILEQEGSIKNFIFDYRMDSVYMIKHKYRECDSNGKPKLGSRGAKYHLHFVLSENEIESTIREVKSEYQDIIDDENQTFEVVQMNTYIVALIEKGVFKQWIELQKKEKTSPATFFENIAGGRFDNILKNGSEENLSIKTGDIFEDKTQLKKLDAIMKASGGLMALKEYIKKEIADYSRFLKQI